MDHTKEIFSIKEAAAFLRVHRQTVETLIRERKIRAKRIGRVWRIQKTQIMTLFRQ